MFSHGRSLIGLLIIFFVLLFIPVVGPLLAMFLLLAAAENVYSSPKDSAKQRAEFERRKAEWLVGKAEFEAEKARKANQKTG